MASMEELLNLMVQRGGSDLHISVGSRPKIRIDGKLYDTEHDVLTPEVTQKIVYSVLTSDQIAKFEKQLEIDFSFGAANLGPRAIRRFFSRGLRAGQIRLVAGGGGLLGAPLAGPAYGLGALGRRQAGGHAVARLHRLVAGLAHGAGGLLQRLFDRPPGALVTAGAATAGQL